MTRAAVALGSNLEDPDAQVLRAFDESGVKIDVVVGSGTGAVPGLPRVRFPYPPAEPDVRVSTHPALHVSCPLLNRCWRWRSRGSGCSRRGSGSGSRRRWRRR